MKGIVIYKGKYNATRQYAGWLSSELGLPLDVSDNIGCEQLKNYDFVALGSAVYIGKLLLKNWLKKNVAELQQKKIFLFVVCGTPTDRREILNPYVNASLPAEIRNSCEIFFLQGRMNRKNLSLTDRLLMKLGTLLERDPQTKKEMGKDYDGVKKENLYELITAIKMQAEKKQDRTQKIY